MQLLVVLVGFTLLLDVAFGYDATNEEFQCGKIAYRLNNCNICSCDDPTNSHLVCTRMGCDYDEAQLSCAPGTSWNQGCNKCWCLKDIGTMCTFNKC